VTPSGIDVQGEEMAKRIEWLTNEEAAIEQAKRTGRAILLDFFKPT
jgi:hypothetical protein